MIAGRYTYDTRLLLQTADQYGLRPSFFAAWCVMLEYAKWWGEWDDEKDGFKRQRLTNAAGQTGIDLPTDSGA